MVQDERQIRAIIEYMEMIPVPESNFPPKYFDDCAYRRWAAEEILIYILAHNNWTVMKSVENFRKKMKRYLDKAMTRHFGYEIAPIFEAAISTAEDISDLIYSMS